MILGTWVSQCRPSTLIPEEQYCHVMERAYRQILGSWPDLLDSDTARDYTVAYAHQRPQ
jgi:hypothetical protein